MEAISKDGTRIAYDKSGSGPLLILVDGALCSRAFGPMPKLARLLTSDFTVITYDRRGRNESSDTQPYAVEREIEDLEALISANGGSAFVTGFSSGAALSLAAAAHGLNITKLALYEPPFMVDQGQQPPADSLQQLQTMIAENRRGDAVKFFLKDMVGVPGIVVFIMKLTPVWSKLKRAAHALPYDVAVLGDFSLPEKKASSVNTQTLISGGGKSPATMQNAVKKLSEIMPNGDLKILKGETHNVAGKVIAPVLIEFFDAKCSSNQ
ncbi:alpha/beta fold hydrolase [Mucilaginibacter sp. BT774]|uniref:alpha/beta fold hydrolase n=1 Tax=Mucilaginibacter sp. BT774 TaxID=3062276 RepID=UPI002677277E|nr:alpha/beta hydrolase [Mucilaginibacter sp. BT774]MDO3626735.1 alpha/beta hydrolase [Mucilaginibacter sp. BT774]